MVLGTMFCFVFVVVFGTVVLMSPPTSFSLCVWWLQGVCGLAISLWKCCGWCTGGQATFTYLPTLSLVPSKTTEDLSLRQKGILLRAVQFFLPGEEAEVALRTGCPCPEVIPQGMLGSLCQLEKACNETFPYRLRKERGPANTLIAYWTDLQGYTIIHVCCPNH